MYYLKNNKANFLIKQHKQNYLERVEKNIF